MIIFKVTNNQGFTRSLEDTFFEKPKDGRGRDQIDPPSCFRVKERLLIKCDKPILNKNISSAILILFDKV